MTTEIQRPAKMSKLLTYLDAEQIGYTIATEQASEHSIRFTVRSLDGRWYQTTVVSCFHHTLSHTSEYGTRHITSTRHETFIVGGASDSTDTRSIKTAMILWDTYGRRIVQAGA